MRLVGSHGSALIRQVAEKEGGSGNNLNSTSEYNICHILRLRVEDREEEEERERIRNRWRRK